MINIPKSILTEIQKIKGCQAIMLTGSRTVGKASKNADWDFFVILKDGVPRWRKTWKIDGEWVEVFCNDQKQIKKEFQEDLQEGRGVTTFMFVSGEIVHDSKGKILGRLVKQAKQNWQKGPKSLTKLGLAWKDYDMATYIQDIEDCLHDNNPALLLINYAVNEFVNNFYRFSNIWFPRPKDRLNDLSKRNSALYQLVQRFNKIIDWREKARKAILIGKFVGEQAELKLTGELYIPPTNKKSFHT